MDPESAAPGPAARPTVVRKYANRRLYDTTSGQFVTLADLHEMIRRGEDFVVREAKTERDITASVLIQIVAEEAGKGNHLLSLGYLRRLLHFYHAGLGEHLSAYLEQSMELFAANQRDLLRHMSHPFDPLKALSTFRDLGTRNAELLARSFELFASTDRAPSARGPEAAAPPAPADTQGAPPAETAEDEVRALRGRLRTIERRLADLERRRGR